MTHSLNPLKAVSTALRLHSVIFFFTLITALSGCAGGQEFMSPPPTPSEGLMESYFPLEVGAYWNYQGTVRWIVGEEVNEQVIRWQMKVIEAVQRGEVSGYHMQGHPSDLAWYEIGKTPSEYAIIRIGQGVEKFYYAGLESFQRLKDSQDVLVDLVQDYDLFLDIPLQPGKRFCEAQQITRVDGMYCWIVNDQNKSPVQLKNIPGANQAGEFTEYSIAQYTLPDHTIVHFTPRIGITGFTYVHHGTASEVEVRLVEFQRGE